ncbi:MAG: homoserine O-acetyltransferase [Ignavibacteria bacterium]|nr:homoserine O-acetyltransferase [Ignavibacteria bacterium]
MTPVNKDRFISSVPFQLERGGVLPRLELQYTIYGSLNEDKSNVVWIIHALTANSDPTEWWEGLTGPEKLFDPEKYCIICANNLGSCYGSSGPLSVNPVTGTAYGESFPLFTIRDMANALDELRVSLGIMKIKVAIGGSTGGQIALEWAIKCQEVFEFLIPIATNARHSAWGIAFNEAQRLALKGNELGLEAARAIAMLSYRSYDSYVETQTDENEKLDDFRASTYQQYQGSKLSKRFDKHSYYLLSKAMDSHNVGRGRVDAATALKEITAKTLVIGISSDGLFPVSEQQFIQENIPGAQLEIINSRFGHDGFLIEYKVLSNVISKFIS